ncbi:AccB Biotin carboxyl carrier protein [Spirosomataceae bacterium]|jgi:acetyl-CoA carboxylase biotin carboxyl carrier protein
MDTREIQKLIDFISKSDLSEVNIETSELKLQIKRNANNPVQYVTAPVFEAVAPQNETVIAPVREAVSAAPVETVANTSHLIEIKAPMIGTFYRSAGPGKPNFIEVGDEITSGKVICILEAMKLFNEIESEVSGKIVKILVDDATPVEYDQPLFLVDPS